MEKKNQQICERICFCLVEVLSKQAYCMAEINAILSPFNKDLFCDSSFFAFK